jgi:hypothetical protein
VNEVVPHATERRFTVSFWFLLALVTGVIAMLLFPAINGDREGVPQIARDTATIHVALRQYRSEFGTLPAGDSLSISRALTGDNPKGTVFIELRSNSPRGDLLDPWGTPYRIYYSADEVLVRSAGRNKHFEVSSDKGFDDYIR